MSIYKVHRKDIAQPPKSKGLCNALPLCTHFCSFVPHQDSGFFRFLVKLALQVGLVSLQSPKTQKKYRGMSPFFALRDPDCTK